jgi:amidase
VIVMSDLSAQTQWLDATGQAELVRSGQVTPLELLEAAIERIEAADPVINAVVMRWFDHARGTAAGPPPAGVFSGVPFLLKDWVAAYAGQPLASGNRRLKEAAQPATADSVLVSRFRAAGLVIAGRTNTPEFASQVTTEPAAWGATRNPWNLAYSPGGSSGGAAAAVATGMVPVAHATDGSGSIRIPAACCGLVGLKPSQGRITAGPSGDESGPGVELCVSRTVRDTALMLDAVRGPGIGDRVTAPPPDRPYVRELGAKPKALRIGVLDRYPAGDPVHPDCADAAQDAGRLLQSLGHHVEAASPAALADPGIGRQIGLVASSHLALAIDQLAGALGRDVTADDVEPVTWARAQRGRQATAVDHARAMSACTRYRRAVCQWWADGYDLLLTPTTGEPPALLGTLSGDPASQSPYTAFTRPFNITGQPAVSLPLSWNSAGLPIGVQLVAAYGREDLLISVAAQAEQARPWASRKPPGQAGRPGLPPGAIPPTKP